MVFPSIQISDVLRRNRRTLTHLGVLVVPIVVVATAVPPAVLNAAGASTQPQERVQPTTNAGVSSATPLEDLVSSLVAPEASDRRKAAAALLLVGRKAGPQYAIALRDGSKQLRIAVAMHIRSINDPVRNDPVKNALVAMLSDDDIDIRRAAAYGMCKGKRCEYLGQDPDTLKCLLDTDHVVRGRVALATRDMGTRRSRDYLPALLQALRDPHQEIQDLAFARFSWFNGRLVSRLRGATRFGPSGTTQLMSLATDGDSESQILATIALVHGSDHSKRPKMEASLVLLKALNHEDRALRRAAARTLRWCVGTISRSGPRLAREEVVSQLRVGLKDSDPHVRRDVSKVLLLLLPKDSEALAVALAGDRATVAKCLRRLQDPDPMERYRGLAGLRGTGDALREAVPEITRALYDKEFSVRVTAASILTLVPEQARSAAPRLSQMVEAGGQEGLRTAFALSVIAPDAANVSSMISLLDDDKRGRSLVIVALGCLGERAAPAVPVLIRMLTDPAQGSDAMIIEVLGKIGPPAKEAVPALLEALKKAKSPQTRSIIQSIGYIGPDAAPAVGELTKLVPTLKGDGSYAAYALGRIGPAAKAALPVLREAMNHKYERHRMGAAFAVARIDDDPSKGLAMLKGFMASKNSGTRESAAMALGELGPLAKSAVPELERELERELGHKNTRSRHLAAMALVKVDPGNRAAIAALLDVVRVGHQGIGPEQIRRQAMAALVDYGQAAVPVLVGALQHDSLAMRYFAATLLGRIGPSARDATKALRQGLTDDSPLVRQAAKAALAKIVDPSSALGGGPISKRTVTTGIYILELFSLTPQLPPSHTQCMSQS